MTAVHPSLGEFEVLHALKAGGMGEVLLARRRGPAGFEQLCAVKTIRPELAATPLVRAMFLDEARLLARLTHPAIAHILAFGEERGTVFMAMEYVAGEHFRRFGERRPPPAIVCQAMASACRGLHAAHELRDLSDGHLLGVVHRDISPDNLMLGFDGRVKVLDFGIALVKGRQAPATELGVLKGKPPYMSPEQLRNQDLDRRADIFSVAVVLHELLTGRHLFSGDSIYAVVHAVEHQVIDPPSTLAGPLPRDLDELVMAGLERDRELRLRSAAEMAEVLERIAARSGGESLESWAERELAADRDAHRRWMSDVMTGAGTTRIGRPTGVVTALAERPPSDPSGAGPRGVVEDAVGATQLAEVSSLGPSTAATPAHPIAAPQRELALTEATSLTPSPRRRAPLVIAGLLLVAGLAALVLVLMGRGPALVTSPPADAAIDAAIDAWAPPPVDAGPQVIDAAAIIDVPIDAAAVDARRAHDAAVVTPRAIDAAVVARIDAAMVAAGTGFLSVGSLPVARVMIDGEEGDITPFSRMRIPAGHHRIVLVDVVTGAVLAEREIEVVAGEEAKVHHP